MKLKDEIVHFFKNQGFVIVTTADKKGMPHNACKDIVSIKESGEIFLLDLYLGKTFKNLKNNCRMNITAVDEHRFKGYCFKGRARIVGRDKLNAAMIKAWDEKITSRITKRLIKNLHEEKGHSRHPEALLPKPQYMIIFKAESVVDLTPRHLR